MEYFYIKCFMFLMIIHLSSAKYQEGVIETKTSKDKDVWRFMARFCFVSEGSFEFKFEYPEKYEMQSINLYYDEPDKWAKVYESNMDCEKRTSLPYTNASAGHRIFLRQSSVECVKRDGILKCEGDRVFNSARQRWWYMVVSRCRPDRVRNDVKGMKLKYELTMTNGKGLFFKHFSADEFYILQIDITFLVITFILLLITCMFIVKLRKKQLLHTTFKMFVTSLAFHLIYLFFITINYGAYANDGIERFGFQTFARVWEALFDFTFILMLILMGKGYTITRGKLRTVSWVKIIIFMSFFAVCYLILLIVEYQTYNAANVLYRYESIGGLGLLILRCIAFVWFLYASIFTMKHYPEKRKFYIPFVIFFSIWFLATPVVVALAIMVMADWVRATVVNAIELFIVFCGQIFFMILTAPSSANKNFPFHVKANKIGFMVKAPHHSEDHNAISDSEDEEPNVTSRRLDMPRLEREVTRASAPYSTSNTAPNFMDLFTTSQTHSEANPERGRSPPPVYSVSEGVPQGSQYSQDSPPPSYSSEPNEPERRATFSNNTNPFITQR